MAKKGKRSEFAIATPLSRTTNRWDRQMQNSNESARTKRLTHRSAVSAARAASRGPTLGRVSRGEQKAIHLAVKAALSNTTRAEAQGVKKILRRKARRS